MSSPKQFDGLQPPRRLQFEFVFCCNFMSKLCQESMQELLEQLLPTDRCLRHLRPSNPHEAL